MMTPGRQAAFSRLQASRAQLQRAFASSANAGAHDAPSPQALWAGFGAEMVRKLVRRHPLAAVAGSFVLGALVARFLPGRLAAKVVLMPVLAELAVNAVADLARQWAATRPPQK